jgi:hypothetical protein
MIAERGGSRAISPAEQAIAAYKWITVAQIMSEMDTSRSTVINIIKAGEFGRGNVTKWGREYRVRPEAWAAYKARRAEEIDAEVGA